MLICLVHYVSQVTCLRAFIELADDFAKISNGVLPLLIFILCLHLRLR